MRFFLVVVDDTPEMENALCFAALRARRTNAGVALLHVCPPADFQHWSAVGSLMRQETRAEAEKLIQDHAAQVFEILGRMPILYIREGDTKAELLKLIEEDPTIRVLVLGAATGSKGPGPLINFLTKRIIGRLRVPVTIVPGGLTRAQIEDVV